MNIVSRVAYNHLPDFSRELVSHASRAVRRTVHGIERTAKESMEGPKSGRIYIRFGREHQASAPGEAPAIDLGALQNSIQSQMITPVWGVVYTNQDYAPALEYGTRHMAARPFMLPAADTHRESFIEEMARLGG